MGIFKRRRTPTNNSEPPEFPEVEPMDKISVTRMEEFIPHFVYSHSENRVIGSIYLTEEQVDELNALMKYKGIKHQDLVFLRKL